MIMGSVATSGLQRGHHYHWQLSRALFAARRFYTLLEWATTPQRATWCADLLKAFMPLKLAVLTSCVSMCSALTCDRPLAPRAEWNVGGERWGGDRNLAVLPRCG